MASIPNQFQGDLNVNGNLAARSISLPANTVGDTQVKAGAPGAYVSAEKLGQQIKKTYAQANTTSASETRAIHIGYGASGTLLAFVAASIAVAVGGATVTVDLKKNGTSVLSAPITLDSSSVVRVSQSGTIMTANYVVGDFFEIVIVATAGGGTIPTGVVCQMTADEDPQ